MSAGSSSRSTGGVTTIKKWNELVKCLRDAGSNLVVLEFMAPWSEPCKSMERPYEEVASNTEFSRKNVRFIAVNFDKFENLGRHLRVESMPTFLMVKNLWVVDRIVALTKDDLNVKIREMLEHSPAEPPMAQPRPHGSEEK